MQRLFVHVLLRRCHILLIFNRLHLSWGSFGHESGWNLNWTSKRCQNVSNVIVLSYSSQLSNQPLRTAGCVFTALSEGILVEMCVTKLPDKLIPRQVQNLPLFASSLLKDAHPYHDETMLASPRFMAGMLWHERWLVSGFPQTQRFSISVKAELRFGFIRPHTLLPQDFSFFHGP